MIYLLIHIYYHIILYLYCISLSLRSLRYACHDTQAIYKYSIQMRTKKSNEQNIRTTTLRRISPKPVLFCTVVAPIVFTTSVRTQVNASSESTLPVRYPSNSSDDTNVTSRKKHQPEKTYTTSVSSSTLRIPYDSSDETHDNVSAGDTVNHIVEKRQKHQPVDSGYNVFNSVGIIRSGVKVRNIRTHQLGTVESRQSYGCFIKLKDGDNRSMCQPYHELKPFSWKNGDRDYCRVYQHMFSDFQAHFNPWCRISISLNELSRISDDERFRTVQWNEGDLRFYHKSLMRAIPHMSNVLGGQEWSYSTSYSPEQSRDIYIHFLNVFLQEHPIDYKFKGGQCQIRSCRSKISLLDRRTHALNGPTESQGCVHCCRQYKRIMECQEDILDNSDNDRGKHKIYSQSEIIQSIEDPFKWLKILKTRFHQTRFPSKPFGILSTYSSLQEFNSINRIWICKLIHQNNNEE